MYTLLLALIYLAFISLGLPDSLLGSGWPVMHNELGVPVSYMGVEPSFGPSHPQIWNENRDGRERVSHCARVAWLFLLQPLLDADAFRDSLRPWCRSD